MKHLFISIIAIFISIPLNAQTTKPCGTKPLPDDEFELLPWYGNNAYLLHFADSIKLFERNPMYLSKTSIINEIPESNYKVPIQFWIYRDENGNDNGIDDNYLQNELDELNTLYLLNGTQIQFYKTCENFYIDDDSLLYVDENEQQNIIRNNFENGVINVHIVRDMPFAGVFWQLITREGVIINHTWENFGTLSHEIGHYFSLEHTHRNSDKGKCRQEAVSRTREFTFWDCTYKTGLVCEKNGDGFCDTEADPNLNGGIYTTGCIFTDNTITDNWGDLYADTPPNTANIMSYMSPRTCRDFFSPSQSIAMVDKLIKRGYEHDNSNPIERYFFDQYEPDNFSTTARNIPLNTLQHHTFHWTRKSKNEVVSCDEDWLMFTITSVNQGELLQIYTDNGLFEDADTEIWVYKSDDLSNPIAHDDNSNNNGYSSIVLENLEIGNYLIKVINNSELPENSIQDYTIMVRECVPYETCVSGVVRAGETKIYYAKNELTAPCNGETFVIEDGGEVIFVSEVSIHLAPGFHTENGAKFHTVIGEIGEEACYNNEITKHPIIYRINNYEILDTAIYKSTFIDTAKVIENDINLKIYPNPSNGEFTIKFTLKQDEQINLSIYSFCGAEIKQVIVNQQYTKGIYEEKISLVDFPTGVYFCKLETSSERLTEKIIIEK